MAMAIWHEQRGDVDAALVSIERAARLSASAASRRPEGAMLGRHGRAKRRGQVLSRLEAKSQAGYVPPTCLAAVQAALGERESALDYLGACVSLQRRALAAPAR